MPQTFKLPCPSCERSIPVTPPQAGESLICECGATLQAPTLREIRQLEPIDEARTTSPSEGASWNPLKGTIFVLGMILIVSGLIGHFRINPQRQSLATEAPPFEELDVAMDSITPVQAWSAWDYFRRQDLEYRDTPEFLANRQKHTELSFYIYLVWGLAICGVVMVIISLLIPSRR